MFRGSIIILVMRFMMSAKPKKAAQHYKRATALKPDFSDAHDPLNKFLWQRGKARRNI